MGQNFVGQDVTGAISLGQNVSGAGRRGAELRGAGRHWGNIPGAERLGAGGQWGRTSWGRTSWGRTSLGQNLWGRWSWGRRFWGRKWVTGEAEGTAQEFEPLEWCKKMLKLPAFYLLVIPLLFWGVLWGYFLKILPTAIPSISDSRNLIPLGAVIGGACAFLGATLWDFISKATNNLFCISLASLMIVAAAILSILTFPKEAATEILEVGSAETYIKPDSIYVVVIQGLIMLADVGLSIIFFAAAGQIYGEGTTLGYASNMIGFSFFYICSMFAPDLFNLHSYCYLMIAAVLLTCFTFFTGLRKFI